MLPKGWKKKPFEFDHARGCPLGPKKSAVRATSGQQGKERWQSEH
jgi:hypothetical protein